MAKMARKSKKQEVSDAGTTGTSGGASSHEEIYELLDPGIIVVNAAHNSRYGITEVDDLVDDILKRGQVTPIACRSFGSEIILVAGDRRLRAIQKINDVPGLLEQPMRVKALISNIGEKEAFLLSVAENARRQDTSPLDTAWQVKTLTGTYKMSQKEVAEEYSMDQAWVSRIGQILNLPPDIRDLIAAGKLGYTAALELLAVEDKGEQKKLAGEIASGDGKVTREAVRAKTPAGKKRAARKKAAEKAAASRSAPTELERRTLKQSREVFERWGTPNKKTGEERKPIHAVCNAIAGFLDGKTKEKTLRRVLTEYLK